MAELARNGIKWTEDETILAFYYYCQIPFGKISHTNPQIIQIAQLMGRSPGSVTFKMGNLGHFDPSLQNRGIVGLSHAGKLDEKVATEFLNNWEELSYKAREIEARLKHEAIVEWEPTELPIGADVIRETKQRVNQDFFRHSVLSSYSQRCCITGLTVPSLLVASHIKPWKVSDPKTERTNPCNGLCLNALHDKAFDRGLMTILPDYTVKISHRLKEAERSNETDLLISYEGAKIHLPDKFRPAKEFLEYHNDVIFEKLVV